MDGFTPQFLPSYGSDVVAICFSHFSPSVPSRIHQATHIQYYVHHYLVREVGFEPTEDTPVCPHWLPRPVASTTRSLPVGRDSRTRTCDLVLPKHAYYQLYYIPLNLLTAFNGCNPALDILYFHRIVPELHQLHIQFLQFLVFTFFFCHFFSIKKPHSCEWGSV